MAVSIHPKLETGLMADSNAAFIAFICNDVKQYVNTPESWGVRDKKVTLLGMTSRYDSTQGFIGGMVDPGETILQAAVRECKEEAGYDVDASRLHLVCTHKIRDNMNAHLYACSVSVEEMYEIQRLALSARDARIEAGGFIVHHIHSDTFQNLIESSLAKTVREELYTLDQLGYL